MGSINCESMEITPADNLGFNILGMLLTNFFNLRNVIVTGDNLCSTHAHTPICRIIECDIRNH
jgi:hypothetical protein